MVWVASHQRFQRDGGGGHPAGGDDSAPGRRRARRQLLGTVVSAEDQFDNVDTAFSGSVTVALDNNPTGTTLGGTLTVGAVAGQATFSGLTLDAVGNGYTLQATASHLTPATTQSFDVSRPGIATQLVVITSPKP